MELSNFCFLFSVPGDHGDHGDHGTRASDKIDQKTKVGQNTRYFLRIFFPAYFDHWKLRKSLLVVVVVVVGGKNDSSVKSPKGA